MAYSTGWEESHDAPEAGRRGPLRAATTALWAGGGLALVVGVVVWAYSLGARDAADVAALSARGGVSYLESPTSRGGASTPGADVAAYDVLGEAAAPTGDLILGAPIDRASPADLETSRQRLSLSEGDPASQDEFIVFIDDALSERAASDRTVELEPVAPRAGAYGEIGTQREDLPPNVGAGSEDLPPSTVAYTSGATDAPPDAAAAALDAGAAVETAPAPVGAAPDVAPTPDRAPSADVATASNASSNAAPSIAGPAIYQVQLAALDSVAAVERRWEEVRAANGDLVGSLALDVQPFNHNNLRVYRLRLGDFSSREQARRLCQQLVARGLQCFVATK